MAKHSLIVTLDESAGTSQSGGSLDDYVRVLGGLVRALHLMVKHLGELEMARGRSHLWAQEHSGLHIAQLQTRCLSAELTYAPMDGEQRSIEDYGQRAFEALRDWDGTEDSTLPKPVTDCLYEAVAGVADEARLYFGSREQPKRTRIKVGRSVSRAQTDSEPALLQGWLKEVNWDKQTAQLHNYSGDYVRLRFDDALSEEMLRLATQFVEVRGSGRFNDKDEWISVHVEELLETPSWSEPFDLDAFLNNPNPKRFNPDEMVTASEPFDVEEFIRTIREGREA